MASITIRHLDDSPKSRLRIQAALNGRSIKDDSLRSSPNQKPQERNNLGTATNALFKPVVCFDLPLVPREPPYEPPTFDK